MRVAGSLSGTSHAGNEHAKRPGEESSKINLSYDGLASRIGRASRHRRRKRAAVFVDLRPRPLLGDRNQEAILVLAIERFEWQAGQDLVFHETPHHSLRRLRELDRELLEEG